MEFSYLEFYRNMWINNLILTLINTKIMKKKDYSSLFSFLKLWKLLRKVKSCLRRFYFFNILSWMRLTQKSIHLKKCHWRVGQRQSRRIVNLIQLNLEHSQLQNQDYWGLVSQHLMCLPVELIRCLSQLDPSRSQLLIDQMNSRLQLRQHQLMLNLNLLILHLGLKSSAWFVIWFGSSLKLLISLRSW